MGRNDRDSWTAADPANEDDANGPDAGDAAGSLMSVQIRRSRPARKRGAEAPPPGADAEETTQARLSSEKAAHSAGPAGTAAGDTEPSHGPGQPEEILAYWSRLRGSRLYPSFADLDMDRITADWPNSVLFRCRAGSRALEPDRTFGPKGGGTALTLGSEPGRIELSPMMLQWLLSLAGEAVYNRGPVEDSEAFPAAKQSIGYRAIALPMGESQGAVDHVLCHVRQA